MRRTSFPIVADNEPILGPNPQMRLYEESDLISNIRGHYQEKDYGQQEDFDPVKEEDEMNQIFQKIFCPRSFMQSLALIQGGTACRKQFALR